MFAEERKLNSSMKSSNILQHKKKYSINERPSHHYKVNYHVKNSNKHLIDVIGQARNNIPKLQKTPDITYPPPSNMWKVKSELENQIGLQARKQPKATPDNLSSYTSNSSTINNIYTEENSSPGALLTTSSSPHWKSPSVAPTASGKLYSTNSSKVGHAVPYEKHQQQPSQQRYFQGQPQDSLYFLKSSTTSVHSEMSKFTKKDNKFVVHYPKPLFTGLIPLQNTLEQHFDTSSSVLQRVPSMNGSILSQEEHSEDTVAEKQKVFRKILPHNTQKLPRQGLRAVKNITESPPILSSLKFSPSQIIELSFSSTDTPLNKRITVEQESKPLYSTDTEDPSPFEQHSQLPDHNDAEQLNYGVKEHDEPGYIFDGNDEAEPFIGETSPTSAPKTSLRDDQSTKQNTPSKTKIAEIIKQNGIQSTHDQNTTKPGTFSNNFGNHVYEQTNKTMKLSNDNIFNDLLTEPKHYIKADPTEPFHADTQWSKMEDSQILKKKFNFDIPNRNEEPSQISTEESVRNKENLRRRTQPYQDTKKNSYPVTSFEEVENNSLDKLNFPHSDTQKTFAHPGANSLTTFYDNANQYPNPSDEKFIDKPYQADFLSENGNARQGIFQSDETGGRIEGQPTSKISMLKKPIDESDKFSSISDQRNIPVDVKHVRPHGPSIAFDSELPALISRSISASYHKNNANTNSKIKTKTRASAKASGSASSSATSDSNSWSNGKSSSSMSHQMVGNQQKLQDLKQKVQDLRHHTYKGSRTSYGWGQGQGFGYGKTSYGRGGGHAWAGDSWEQQSGSPPPYPVPNNGQTSPGGNSGISQAATQPQTDISPQASAPSATAASATNNHGPASSPQYVQNKPSQSLPPNQKIKLLRKKKNPGNKFEEKMTAHTTYKKLGKEKQKRFGEQATGSGYGMGFGNKQSWGQGGGYSWAGKPPPQGAPNPADFLQKPASVPEIPNVPEGSTGKGSFSDSGGTNSSGQNSTSSEEPSASSEQQPPEQQPSEQQPSEQQLSEQQPTEQQPSEQQPSEQQPSEQQSSEQTSVTSAESTGIQAPPGDGPPVKGEYYIHPNTLASNVQKIQYREKKLKEKFKESDNRLRKNVDKNIERIKQKVKTFRRDPWVTPRFDPND